MDIKISDDKAYIIYGPYQGGDKPEFTADPVVAMVSFDIFDDKVRHSKLYRPYSGKMVCLNEKSDEYDGWCVVTSDGKVGDHIENLYFMFPRKQDAPEKSDVEDTVDHPKSDTGRKSDEFTWTTFGPYDTNDIVNVNALNSSATASFHTGHENVLNEKVYKDDSGYYVDVRGRKWWIASSLGRVPVGVSRLFLSSVDGIVPRTGNDDHGEDEVDHPKHYTGRNADVECIMFTELLPSLAANAFKYVWRCDDKNNKTEDLKKARWYLARICAIEWEEHVPHRRVRRLMSGIIEGSDFDDWHKRVLIAIINGYYIDAYNDISDLIGKPKYVSDMF